MKYKVKIPLANYPDTRTHDKEFDNVLDVIDYFKAIINDEIEDDWNCHIQEAITCAKILNLGNTVISKSKEFEDLYEEYNEVVMINYMFDTYVKQM
jgi:hypothetical protein